MTKAPMATSAPDLSAMKARQMATWAFGDYAVVGVTLQIVGETLCEGIVVPSEYLEVIILPGRGTH
jgi:hypothetical protein